MLVHESEQAFLLRYSGRILIRRLAQPKRLRAHAREVHHHRHAERLEPRVILPNERAHLWMAVGGDGKVLGGPVPLAGGPPFVQHELVAVAMDELGMLCHKVECRIHREGI